MMRHLWTCSENECAFCHVLCVSCHENLSQSIEGHEVFQIMWIPACCGDKQLLVDWTLLSGSKLQQDTTEGQSDVKDVSSHVRLSRGFDVVSLSAYCLLQ